MRTEQNGPTLPVRLTREENRALTRAKILKIARKHFLTRGYAGTILEQVSEEAGFSRGALYSNFSGKEDLFLAVFDSDLHMHMSQYHSILDSELTNHARVPAFRDAFVRHVTSRDWGILRTEFELSALHNDLLRKRFSQIHRRDLENATELAQKAIDTGDLALSVPMEQFLLSTQSFMMGLALKQRLLVRDVASDAIADLAGNFFDVFIAPHLRQGPRHQRATS